MFQALVLVALLVSAVVDADSIPYNPSIVKVQDIYSRWYGTAFQLNTKHGPRLITNRHVCADETNMMVEGMPALSLATKYSYHQAVTVEGFPKEGHTKTTGLVGKYIRPDNKATETMKVLYTGLVNYGNSGSPVLNESGDVVGVISIKLFTKPNPNEPDIGGFIPLEFLRDFLGENNR